MYPAKGRRRAAFFAVPLLLLEGCRSVALEETLSPNWGELVRSPAPFAALYRLSCCGQRHLPTVVRSEGERLTVAVSVPPGGVAWEAWFDARGGVARQRRESCVFPLPIGQMVVAQGVDLPGDPRLWARLLAGRLPPEVAPVEDRPGWVAGAVAGWNVAARCQGVPPRCLEVRLERDGVNMARLLLDRHHGRVPGRIRAKVGRERLVLELSEWGSTAALTEPNWLGWPRCGW